MAGDDSIPSFSSLRMPARRARKSVTSSAKTRNDTAPQLTFDLEPPVPDRNEAYKPIFPKSVQPARMREPLSPIATPSPPLRIETQGPIRYTVRQLINDVRLHIEGAFTGLVYVEGEISNCRPAASGHIYFTLKDGDAQLPVVLFRRQALLLDFKVRDGLAVEVRGRVSVYETRGQLQLIAETLRPRGTGALQLAFEQLRDRLRKEGLFDRPKQALPPFPHCIGIVTSPHGAAIRDIIQVVRRRHARLNLLIYPAVMQGVQCSLSVAAGVRWFNRHPDRVDLIILARGGGSLEDLAGFNDELLARSIVASTLPVVSAIGHEIDNTIADYVADLRAPTPSAAAELVTAAQHRIEERVASLERRVHRAGTFYLMQSRQRLQQLSADYVLDRIWDAVQRREQLVDELRFRMTAAVSRRLRSRVARVSAIQSGLHRHDPTVRLAVAQRRLSATSNCLERLATQLTLRRRARLERAALRLTALSPLAVLNRGYAIVYIEPTADAVEGRTFDASILRDASAVSPNQRIRARLAHGSVRALITETIKP